MSGHPHVLDPIDDISPENFDIINKKGYGLQKHQYVGPDQNAHRMKEMVLRTAKESEFWEQKFDKYYKKISKLQQRYDEYLSSLQAVLWKAG